MKNTLKITSPAELFLATETEIKARVGIEGAVGDVVFPEGSIIELEALSAHRIFVFLNDDDVFEVNEGAVNFYGNDEDEDDDTFYDGYDAMHDEVISFLKDEIATINAEYDAPPINTLKITAEATIDDSDAYGDQNCVNFYARMEIEGQAGNAMFPAGSSISINVSKKDGSFCVEVDGLEFQIIGNDNAFWDGVGYEKAITVLNEFLRKENAAAKVLAQQLELDKNEDICEHCGNKMEYDYDWSKAQATPGGSIGNIDDVFDTGHYSCTDTDCYGNYLERHY